MHQFGWTSKFKPFHFSSWIISTAIDFEPYSNAQSNIRHYAISLKDSAHKFSKGSSFDDKDSRYKMLINMTKHDIDSAIEKLDDAYTTYFNLIGVMPNGIRHNYKSISKRSLLPLGGVLSFLFGTADRHDVNAIKKDVKALYDNQMRQSEVLDDVLSITNVSRGLITENRLKINNLIDSVLTLNETLTKTEKELEPLFVTK